MYNYSIINFLLSNFGIVIFFAVLYMIYIKFNLSSNSDNQFNGLNSKSTFIDFLYFSFSVQTTVGFGDIFPKTKIAKILIMSQQLTLLFGLDIIKKYLNVK
tara:strand:- start:58 stop:360 length:303 start_codon:yes stop_codon:yes gene_type:complete